MKSANKQVVQYNIYNTAIAIKYMGLLESPSPRKMELIILYAVINGIPIKHIVR